MSIQKIEVDSLYRGVPVKGWDQVEKLINAYASGQVPSSHATTDNLFEAIGESSGGLGVALLALSLGSAAQHSNAFVDRMLAEAAEQLKTRDTWHRSYDYDGVGVFFKTSVEIEEVKPKTADEPGDYIVSISAAYVGDEPEKQLAAGFKINRALIRTGLDITVDRFDETQFQIDFGPLMAALNPVWGTVWTGEALVDMIRIALQSSGYSNDTRIVVWVDRDADLQVTLSLSCVSDYRKWVDNVRIPVWTFDGPTITGPLDTSYKDDSFIDPVVVLTVTGIKEEHYYTRYLYQPTHVAAAEALTQRMKAAVEAFQAPAPIEVEGPMFGPELPPDFEVSVAVTAVEVVTVVAAEVVAETKVEPDPIPAPDPEPELPEDLGEKVFTLPDRDTLRARLVAVNDLSHLQEQFYPLLLREAGNEKVAIGVIMMLMLAISDYCKNMPPSIMVLMNMDVDRYIRALILDEKLAEYTVNQWNDMSAMR